MNDQELDEQVNMLTNQLLTNLFGDDYDLHLGLEIEVNENEDFNNDEFTRVITEQLQNIQQRIFKHNISNEHLATIFEHPLKFKKIYSVMDTFEVNEASKQVVMNLLQQAGINQWTNEALDTCTQYFNNELKEFIQLLTLKCKRNDTSQIKVTEQDIEQVMRIKYKETILR